MGKIGFFRITVGTISPVSAATACPNFTTNCIPNWDISSNKL